MLTMPSILVHVNVPDHDHAGVSKGWKKYYWKQWRDYLARKDNS